MLHIFTYFTNEDESQLKYLKESSTLFNTPIQCIIQDLSKPNSTHTNNMCLMQKAIQKIPDDDVVCFINARDVLVAAGVDEILRKFLDMDANLVISAELNSYPWGYHDKYPVTRSRTNYRFINSKGYIGYKSAIVDMFSWKSVEEIRENGDDQRYFIDYYLANYKDGARGVCLDHKAKIFQNMFMTDWSEFDFISGRVYNRALQETPCFVHFNGESWKTEKEDTIIPVFLDKMRRTKIPGVILSLNGHVRCKWPNSEVRPSLA